MTDVLPSTSVESATVDRCLSRDLRSILEERFWRQVEEVSTLEAVSGDGWVISTLGLHPALFADHGIVHVRDVAAGVVELARTADGTLLPPRPADRRDFVVGLAVLIAYIHDAGMHDPTPEGRRIHALRAAQEHSQRGSEIGDGDRIGGRHGRHHWRSILVLPLERASTRATRFGASACTVPATA